MSDNDVLPYVVCENCTCGTGKYARYHATSCGQNFPKIEDIIESKQMSKIEKRLDSIEEQVNKLEEILNRTEKVMTKLLEQFTRSNINLEDSDSVSDMEIG